MRDGCPCTVEGIEPCGYACSCANPVMSGGCRRCAKYGSLEQRQGMARYIADKLASSSEAVERDNLAATIDILEQTKRERDALQRDAARYRWLRQHVAPEDIEFYISHDGGDPLEDISAETDSAIDAAMRQSAGEGKE